MLVTRCPKCHRPARLTSARSVGPSFVPELGAAGEWCDVTERRVECQCAEPGRVHVAIRLELYRGESRKRTVNLPRISRRARH